MTDWTKPEAYIYSLRLQAAYLAALREEQRMELERSRAKSDG